MADHPDRLARVEERPHEPDRGRVAAQVVGVGDATGQHQRVVACGVGVADGDVHVVRARFVEMVEGLDAAGPQRHQVDLAAGVLDGLGGWVSSTSSTPSVARNAIRLPCSCAAMVIVSFPGVSVPFPPGRPKRPRRPPGRRRHAARAGAAGLSRTDRGIRAAWQAAGAERRRLATVVDSWPGRPGAGGRGRDARRVAFRRPGPALPGGARAGADPAAAHLRGRRRGEHGGEPGRPRRRGDPGLPGRRGRRRRRTARLSGPRRRAGPDGEPAGPAHGGEAADPRRRADSAPRGLRRRRRSAHRRGRRGTARHPGRDDRGAAPRR